MNDSVSMVDIEIGKKHSCIEKTVIIEQLKMVRCDDMTVKMKLSEMLTQATGCGLNAFPGMLVATMTPEIALDLDHTKYMVALKLDGLRSVCIVNAGILYVLFRDMSLYSCKVEAKYDSAVFDCEWIWADEKLQGVVFDAMFYNGVRQRNFITHRFNAMYDVVENIVIQGCALRVQGYVQFRAAFRNMTPTTEGLVFIRRNSEYKVAYGRPVAYKYVRPAKLTVDLRVVNGVAGTYDGVKVYEGVQVDDGVYEFTLDGTPGALRYKPPNSEYVVNMIRRCSSFGDRTLFDNVLQRVEIKRQRSYDPITNVDSGRKTPVNTPIQAPRKKRRNRRGRGNKGKRQVGDNRKKPKSPENVVINKKRQTGKKICRKRRFEARNKGKDDVGTETEALVWGSGGSTRDNSDVKRNRKWVTTRVYRKKGEEKPSTSQESIPKPKVHKAPPGNDGVQSTSTSVDRGGGGDAKT